ncbi:flagellar basal body-associated FliL family protein [Tropicimonas isoalkanivorans]|uniref:Flagellar protein FliL n=1 Tax=Tropicimonas isoalkanivorans TaxID=441112 RepID=A0A1I1PJC0_9RHOB|nr:flagellar basal body-associated FliL family protein [Tropicimonas isoalkanivorans]SFD09945.1 Flagellar basal body-associated protein FliL [Tropicimonas isoalkanivorans]
MRLLLPGILALAGAGAGLTAGHILKPAEVAAETAVHEHGTQNLSDHAQDPDLATDPHGQTSAHGEAPHGAVSGTEFVDLSNRFVVPILKGGRMTSMVVLSLSLETMVGSREDVFAKEPRIRDALLQVMFDYANAGGFDGTYTSTRALDHLRTALREEARQIVGDSVLDVLVTDIARQDS